MTGWRSMVRVAAVALTASAVMLAAGACTHDDTADGADGDQSHRVSARLADVTEATVDVVSGADSVAIRAEDLGDDLYAITTPDDARVRPRVVASGGVYQVHLVDAGSAEREPESPVNDDDDSDAGAGGGNRIAGRTAHDGPATLEIALNAGVRWTLRLDGGAKLTTLDMTRGRVAAVDLAAGVTRIEVALPRPEGTVPVTMRGGASVFTVRLPADVAVRVRVGGGASEVTIGSVTRSGVSGGTVFAPDGWDGAADRYDVDAAAGVSSLTVSTT